MNTITNRRVLKSRMSASWPHDSSHFRFQRSHNSRAPFQSDEPVSWAEVALWGIAICSVGAFLFFVLTLI
ncbi:MAG: hypothetical protein JNK52_16525 [Zoogloeaceae bacterium]|nr:hypothetical protein [Zoogloeaceae bacterium]